MQETGNKKNLIIVAVIILGLGAAVYFYISRDRTSDELLTGVPAGTALATVDGTLLSALRELKKLKLDDSIFKNPIWLSLSDFGRTLAPQPSGRPNPFAPLGANTESFSTSTPL
jgi:hypothetical protein